MSHDLVELSSIVWSKLGVRNWDELKSLGITAICLINETRGYVKV